MNNKYGKTFLNTIMLYLLAFAKIIFPLLTLPYLTRVLTVGGYGVVSYVKSTVGYAQIIIDFGFILSAVKDIVLADGDRKKIGSIVGNTIVAKLILALFSLVLIVILIIAIPILRSNIAFVLLSFMVPVLSSFLLDFYFRGIEKMHLVSVLFVFMKAISTVLTIIFVKSDEQLLLIPIFDILSSILTIVLSLAAARKTGLRICFDGIRASLGLIKKSFGYFSNSMASTAFGALNTVVIGAAMNNSVQIAYWSVCVQLVGAVQTLYTPISNGIYPHMVKHRELSLIKKVFALCMPIVLGGTIFCYLCAPWLLGVVGGEKYVAAAPIMRILLPVLVLSFPVAILGWPVLGAIEKVKEINISTLLAAAVQILGLLLLIVWKKLDLIKVALLRNFSELILFAVRAVYAVKFRRLFEKNGNERETAKE